MSAYHGPDDQASGFYRHFGFEPSPIDDLTLMLLIKDIQSQGGLASATAQMPLRALPANAASYSVKTWGAS